MGARNIVRALVELRKNVACLFPFYHRHNAYLFDRRLLGII